MISQSFSDPARWAELQVGDARLMNKRRGRRAVKIVQAMAENPGLSITRLFSRWGDCKSAYSLFDCGKATPDHLQAGHRERVVEECRKPGVVLMLEDTTTLSFSGREPIEGLGPVGDTKHSTEQGFLVHSVLAVRWQPPPGEPETWHERQPVEVIGLADQQYRVRPKGTRRKRNGGKKMVRREGGANLETQWWENSTRRIGSAPARPEVRWVRVCDREADIYETIMAYREAGHGFVVRACSNRVVVNPETGCPAGMLFERAREAPALGCFELELRARPGHCARTARLKVSAVGLHARSPVRPGHAAGTLPALSFTVVRVWEPDPPEGVEPLEWILLTDATVTCFGGALEVALQYAGRWLIEEFHKALKTGMGAEKLQLETDERLMAAVALMSVAALRLLHLKEGSRLKAAAPAAESGFTDEELTVLELATKRTLRTVGDVALALGHLGGHLNRKSDGMPGWMSLWRGWIKLQGMLTGWRLAKALKNNG